ncbi:MAG: serine hydrolase [Bacteroidota bacterium]
MKRVFWSWLILSLAVVAQAQPSKKQWVDSVFSTMNQTEKIGQLFMLTISSEHDESYVGEVRSRIKSYGIGGIVFTNGGPVRQIKLTNHFQGLSKVPLMIAMDAAHGLGSLLDSTITFPEATMQGALINDSLVYYMSREIARQLKIMGVQMNFAPTANLTNTSEPYLYPTFGENKNKVATKSLMYLKGLQQEGILACAKYFPIRGLTVTDIQKGLPIIKPFIDSTQAFPFKKLFENGLPAVMPASTDLPLFYDKKNIAKKNQFTSSTLSSVFTGDWIENQLNFTGLVIVDIHQMRSAVRRFRIGDAELFAFQAGNDVLLSPQNMSAAVRKIRKLLKKQKQYELQLENSVKKILAAKYDAGLHNRTTLLTTDLQNKLVTLEAQRLSQKMYEHAVTVASNADHTLPIRILENKDFACVLTGNTTSHMAFYNMVSKYVHADSVRVGAKVNSEKLQSSLQEKETIIVALFPETSPEAFDQLLGILRKFDNSKEIIVCDFGFPGFVNVAGEFPAVISAYHDPEPMLKAVPEVLFGALPAYGVLPYKQGSSPEGTGISTPYLQRLGYTFPEEVGMDGKTLTRIEAVANEAISSGATPGCIVVVAKAGKVVYEKPFGYLTYDKGAPVNDRTIYDLASVTKVSATLQAVMFMHDRGLIDLNKKASAYLPELKNSNKKDFTLKDILTHQAGLWPFLPFWAQTMKDSLYLPEFYSHTPSTEYPFMVADKLYASSSMKDSLWTWIVNAKIREKPLRTPFDYRYSDMGFYILQHLSEKILNQPLEDFIQQNLYEPLGSFSTGYLPLLKFPASQIAPTESDKLFRKTLLIGTVHDQGAAMHGGIAGHAGLFSNALDLTKLGQMLLQEGSYGGYQYYKPETVRLFTQRQFATSRRGLGWDKPTPSDWNGPTSIFASPKTFGHTGFTGTCIWVDPEFDLVYVFLSNRVHPDMTNNKLLNANIRSRIQDVIYQSIFNYCKAQEREPIVPAAQ